jgi:hypothetical protein
MIAPFSFPPVSLRDSSHSKIDWAKLLLSTMSLCQRESSSSHQQSNTNTVPEFQYPEPHRLSAKDSKYMVMALIAEAARYQAQRRAQQQSRANPKSPCAPSTARMSAPACDEWLELMDQVNDQFDAYRTVPVEDRLQRTKCLLTPLFLWTSGPTFNVDKDLDVDGHAIQQWIEELHRRRLARLPRGKLFFP